MRDSRVDSADNERFIDMMERYFSQSAADKKAEERPELHYQVSFQLHI